MPNPASDTTISGHNSSKPPSHKCPLSSARTMTPTTNSGRLRSKSRASLGIVLARHFYLRPQLEMALQPVIPVRRVDPWRIGAGDRPVELKQRRVLQQSARGMDRHSTPSDIRFALPIPPECARSHKPRIIELPGIAEGEAAFLMREQEDQGSGGAQKDQSGDCHAMSPASARAFP